MNDVPPVDRGVGMVFQSYALYPHMTVRENLAFGLKIKKVNKMTLNDRVAQASEMLGLDPLLDRKPKAMSGGQRQRVAIIGSPKMNFLGGMLESIEKDAYQVKLDTGVRVIVKASVDASRGNIGDKVELGIRPEHMVMLDDPDADSRITGIVQVAEHLGSESLVYLTVGNRDFTVKVRPDTPAKPGGQFDFGVPAAACYLFDADGIAFPRSARYSRT